jgi:hypothetical protein
MNISDIINNQKLKIASLLILIGILGRISIHDYFNNIRLPFIEYGFLDVFFIIAAISIFSGILIGKYYVFIIPIIIISITDIYYGFVNPINTSYWYTWLFLFTTSGYAFIAILGYYAKKRFQLNSNFLPKILGSGILGVLIYDLWTNFGFWLGFSKLGYYPPTFIGLTSVYISGLPFMLWHILSLSILLTIIITPLLLYKKRLLLSKNIVTKPYENIYILSATIILVSLSILSAII